MSAAPKIPDLPEALRAALDDQHVQTLIIHPATARILAANASARRLLGLPGPDGAAVLDSAMPAVRAIRALAAKLGPEGQRAMLTFWTPAGAKTLDGVLSEISGSAAEDRLVIIRAGSVETSDDGAPEDRTPAVPPVAALVPARDDLQTLNEIARRIREGQTQRLIPADVRSAASIGDGPHKADTAQPADGLIEMPDALPEPATSSTDGLRPAMIVSSDTDRRTSQPVEADPPEHQASGPGQPDDTAQTSARQQSLQPPSETDQPPQTPQPAPPPPLDLAKLAHELKTPVSAIAAASEIIRDERFGPIGNARYAGYVADIHDSARHALALIERMLVRPEPEDGAPHLTFARHDLNQIVSGCVSSLTPLAEAKGVALGQMLSRGTLPITADETSVRQIVLNVLTNAIKFTPRAGRVKVTTGHTSRGGALLAIIDSGPGMSAIEIAEAMKPVPQNSLTRRDGGGLGLGLPLSTALCEANGARLSIESTPGQGTRVSVAFPGGRIVAI